MFFRSVTCFSKRCLFSEENVTGHTQSPSCWRATHTHTDNTGGSSFVLGRAGREESARWPRPPCFSRVPSPQWIRPQPLSKPPRSRSRPGHGSREEVKERERSPDGSSPGSLRQTSNWREIIRVRGHTGESGSLYQTHLLFFTDLPGPLPLQTQILWPVAFCGPDPPAGFRR